MNDFFELFFKVLKFGLVGTLGMAIDFLITWTCKEKIGINKFKANALGFVFAASSNFMINKIWTFNDISSDPLIQFFKFFIICALGLSINSLIIWLLNSRFKYPFYFSKVVAIALVLLWNFTLNYFYTFSE